MNKMFDSVVNGSKCIGIHESRWRLDQTSYSPISEAKLKKPNHRRNRQWPGPHRPSIERCTYLTSCLVILQAFTK